MVAVSGMFASMTRTVFASLAGLAMAAGGFAGAASAGSLWERAEALVPFFADYEMEHSGEIAEPGIAAVSGRLVLEFRGGPCAGYVNVGRMVTVLDTTEGDRLVTDTRTRTVEHIDGTMTFENETFNGGTQLESAAGTARRVDDGLRVVLTQPRDAEIDLPGDLAFPTEQVVRVLAAARRGQRFLPLDVYDGSADGSLVYQTATVIGAPETEPLVVDDLDGAVDVSAFVGRERWPVIISHFERGGDDGDSVPDFVLAFDLYDNGISRDFDVDYREFSMTGRLVRLELLPRETCDGEGAGEGE